MYYTEFLRVRNFFTGFAIAIAILGLILMVGHAKVSVGPDSPPAHALAADRSATADEQGASGSTKIYAPGVQVSNEPNTPFPFSALLALAGFVAAIFGTVLGTCLAAENCGHLEIAWTRPASRVSYAARVMLVDAAGILAIFAFTVLTGTAVIYARGWQHDVVMDARIGPVLVSFVLYAFAWFALIAALTASVRTKAGAIAGFSWVGAAILVMLLDVALPPALHAFVRALNYLNPMLYGSYSTGGQESHHIMQLGLPVSILGLSSIIILGLSAALAQWRRLEA